MVSLIPAVCLILSSVVSCVAADAGGIRQPLTQRRTALAQRQNATLSRQQNATVAQLKSAPDDCTLFDSITSADQDCAYLAAYWGITTEDFISWNPQVGTNCQSIIVGEQYCVERNWGIPIQTSTASSKVPEPTSNIPSPVQSGIISGCKSYYQAVTGDDCSKIVAAHGTFSVSDFLAWNPAVGNGCSGLWLGYWYCVAVEGTPTKPPTPSSTTTTTSNGNGVSTPTPVQPGIVKNCNKFYFVKSGDGCAAIAASHSISLSQFLAWNPSAGTDCTGLWANAYACVSVIGGGPTSSSTVPSTTTIPPSTTSTGNGIATPTPTQPGMVSNCNRFHLVKSGDTCASIGARYSMSAQRIQQWNSLTSTCSNLWLNTYVCVHTTNYSIPISLTCNSSGQNWGRNRAAARLRVVDWCDGSSSTDGNGAYSLAQTKTGCYNAPNGNFQIQFTMSNNFGAPASLTTGRCEKLIGEQLDGCSRGGTGVSEGWSFRTAIVAGRC